MFEFHPAFETPEYTTQIWRYMDFVSFVWVLHHSKLWFSRADYFEDKWEGAYPTPTVDALKAAAKDNADNWKQYSSMKSQIKKTIFINCWYSSTYESSAMWQIYAGMGNSIAIQSTIGRLVNSLNEDPKKIHIGRIKYIDYQKDSLDASMIFLPYLRKRKSFTHESEIRLIMWSLEDGNNNNEGPEALFENAPAGHAIKINLHNLIECIFVSPKAKPWFLELVNDMLNKYECGKIMVKQSDFDASPPM